MSLNYRITEKLFFGATVVLVNTDTDEEVTYQIVGDDEADIKSGLISVNSPIARGLVGKELDDTGKYYHTRWKRLSSRLLK